MKTRFRESFTKDLLKIGEKSVLKRIRDVVEHIERTENIKDIPNLKKLKGTTGFYRVRVGDFRVGLAVEDDTVTFVRCLHRREIYRYFP